MATAQFGTLLQHIQKLVVVHGPAPRTDCQLLDDFLVRRDEAAFALLVGQHGPMVLRVCRRVLQHEQDVEDAFQATFLVLARQADSIRKRQAVADWLHGVAYRTAMNAKRSAARRRKHEALRAAHYGAAERSRPSAGTVASPSWNDVQAVLDQEIQRLPDSYRSAFVLCVLEGKSGSEAAAALGIKEGTVSSRLSRARQRLQRQLAQRGIKLGGLLAALAVAEGAGQAGVPNRLGEAAIRSGLLVAAGGSAAGVVPARVAALAAGVTRAMFLTKAKIALALVFAVGLLAAGAGVLAHHALAAGEPQPQETAGQPRAPKQELKPKADPTGEDKGEVTVAGRVLDPEGKPFAGAKVFFAPYVRRGLDLPVPQVATDAAGRFRLGVSRTGYQDDWEKKWWLHGTVVAQANGFAPGWVSADNAEKLTNVTIQLAKYAPVPIDGRVINLEGKPVAGVRVQLRRVSFRQNGKGLNDFVEAIRSREVRGGWWNHPDGPKLDLDPVLLGLPSGAQTGSDGTYRLTGIPAEGLVRLRFEGPTIETSEVYVLTRPGPAIHLPADKELLGSRSEVFHGPRFDHVAAPTRLIEGVVRDRDTGKPLVGVTIQSETYRGPGQGPELRATTDADGRYRLVGLSRQAGHSLLAVPPAGQPYLRAALLSGAAPGLSPVTVDFRLKRGVVIRGRVTDKVTGRPVPALVTYFAFDDNPNLRDAPGYQDSHSIEVRTATDGSFSVLGLPGRGLVAATAASREQAGRYLMAAGADDIRGRREGGDFITHPNICGASRYNTLAEVSPARDAESIVRDLVFDPGKTVTGTIVDPDGRPVTGASIDSVFGVWLRVKDLPTAQFRIAGIDAKHPRSFFFRQGKLGAAVVFTGDEALPVTVRLQKCATIIGRLVDEDGRPVGAWINGYIHKGQLNVTGGVGLDITQAAKDGRFRIEGVIPGLKIGLWAGKNNTYYDQHLVPELTLGAGEVKDLGDLKRKVMD